MIITTSDEYKDYKKLVTINESRDFLKNKLQTENNKNELIKQYSSHVATLKVSAAEEKAYAKVASDLINGGNTASGINSTTLGDALDSFAKFFFKFFQK